MQYGVCMCVCGSHCVLLKCTQLYTLVFTEQTYLHYKKLTLNIIVKFINYYHGRTDGWIDLKLKVTEHPNLKY